MKVVSRELLETLAAMTPKAAIGTTGPATEKANRAAAEHRLYLAAHQVEINREDRYEGGYRFKLKHCLFDPSHKDAATFVDADGKLGYNCFHDHCKKG